ncbi:MAG: arsenic resistance N-acetyltransferase ArsN2 [Fulvivirga sp.]|nr:arsenic resistance N-acetyltransferase ArsN2 [Fulvivirga sp.]
MKQLLPENKSELNKLLEGANLPFKDVDLVKHYYYGEFQQDKLIASFGMEYYGSNVLLRSLVVHPDYRGTGLGKWLVFEAHMQALRDEKANIYLLTTSAPDFFKQLGYDKIDRYSAPEMIQQSSEFGSVCPASAVCMVYNLTLT